MNTECVVTFKDINRYPVHYIYELVQHEEVSFLLYQYGPYIARKYIDYFNQHVKVNEIKNDLLRYMVDISNIVEAWHDKSYKEAKLHLRKIIIACNEYPYQYATSVKSFVNQVLSEMHHIQMKEKSLESAMVNYTPIVPYTGTIRKPELIDLHQTYENSITHIKLDDKIKDLLEKNIMNLISTYSDCFLNIDELYEALPNSSQEIIPSSIMDLLSVNNNDIKTYYLLIYLRYVINDDMRDNVINTIEEILKISNLAINGKDFDIKKALESFEKIAISDNKY